MVTRKKDARIRAKMSYGNTMCDALICNLICTLFASWEVRIRKNYALKTEAQFFQKRTDQGW